MLCYVPHQCKLPPSKFPTGKRQDNFQCKEPTFTKWNTFDDRCAQLALTSIRRRASLVVQLVKNPPAMQETWVWSLGWEDPLEKWKATQSSILAWRIPWACPWDRKESGTTERLSLHSLWEDPLEKGMATHSSIFAWKTSWTEEPGWLQSMGSQRVGHDLATKPITTGAL